MSLEFDIIENFCIIFDNFPVYFLGNKRVENLKFLKQIEKNNKPSKYFIRESQLNISSFNEHDASLEAVIHMISPEMKVEDMFSFLNMFFGYY